MPDTERFGKFGDKQRSSKAFDQGIHCDANGIKAIVEMVESLNKRVDKIEEMQDGQMELMDTILKSLVDLNDK